MDFLSLVVVLLLVQWWGSGQPLHYDGWFIRLADGVENTLEDKIGPVGAAAITLALPVLALVLLQWAVAAWLSTSWWFFINIPVVLYSLGRGDFYEPFERYLHMVRNDDSVGAAYLLDELNPDPDLKAPEESAEWVSLHREALRVFSYRGFERMFAVIFWFMLLGAAGALAYRLLSLYWCHQWQRREALGGEVGLWLRMVEWIPARLMGLTWALVGNFENCMTQWKDYCFKAATKTPVFLAAVLRGSLGDEVEAREHTNTAQLQAPRIEPGYSLELLRLSQSMFSRALLTWVVAAALFTLLV